MAMTLVELNEKLVRMEETYLMELLGISSEDLVERFQDLIEQDFDALEEEAAAEDPFLVYYKE